VQTKFTHPLILEDNEDETFTVVEGFTYDIGYFGSNLTITVPPGTRTDFASIPKLVTPIFPRYGKHTKAAVLHDYLYSLCREKGFPRRLADYFFLESMEVLNVPWIKRYIFYFCVRIFGWLAVRKKINKELKKFDKD